MAVPEMTVEGVVFPPVVACPPGSGRIHFLAGGGVRGLETDEGIFVKIAAIGVYLEDAAVPALARKWAGKTADELASDPNFFRDVHAGEFEKLTRVTFIWPRAVPGEEFSAKVAESRVAYLKATGPYTDAEAAAVEEFKAAFKTQSLAPGGSVFFTHSPAGVLTVAFSEDSSSVPESATAAIENKALCEAVLRVHHRGARRLAGDKEKHRYEDAGAPQGRSIIITASLRAHGICCLIDSTQSIHQCEVECR